MTQATISAIKTFSVFDTDSHVLEPAAVWDTYLEPEYRTIARSAFWHERDEVGVHTVLNGKPAKELHSPNLPRYAIWRPGMTPRDIGRLDPQQRHAPNPGATNVTARLKDMDAMGVDQALMFPTYFLEYFPVVDNPDVAWALARAYNRWVLEFSQAAPARLVPVAVLPLQDPVLAIKEARRVAKKGFKAVLVRPVFNNGIFPTQTPFWPLWQEMEALGLMACLHPSAGPAAAELDATAPFIERVLAYADLGHPGAEFVAPALDNGTALVAMMADGFMQKWPRLKLLFTHSGTAWVGLALEKIETYLWLSHQAEPVSLEPEVLFFNRANLVSFESGDETVRWERGAYEGTGAWGSRYPNHDTGTAWDAIQRLREGGLSEPLIERLMGGNAVNVLGVEAALYVKQRR